MAANATVEAKLDSLANALTNVSAGAVTSYPVGATPVTAASGNVANAAASATLPGTASKTTYITGFSITGSGATVGLPVTVLVSGATATLPYTYGASVGALIANTPLVINYPFPIPASAANTAISVTCPALGAGATNNTLVVQGYQL